MGHKQPGLDGRHRDNDGEIHRKRGDTLIGTIRKDHPDFAPGTRSNSRLDTYLDKTGYDSLTDALKRKPSSDGQGRGIHGVVDASPISLYAVEHL